MVQSLLSKKNRGGGAVGYSIRRASGRLGVRIPATADTSRSDSSTAKHPALSRVLGDDHYKRMPSVTVGAAH